MALWAGLGSGVGAAGAQSPLPTQAPAAARQCITCHGPLGVGSAPDTPHLAAQPVIYLAAQLRAYRSGARQHAVMNVIARPLSDADIGALADWYSSIRIEAMAP